ncbi:3042_t:CDS:2 [Diversispora eburnea]|uniref:3042_t:CDS:1 n=1 Tax=Diversispora eburnea TaxID=1213867 RepID=A0A9N8V317_9GLOM|nr:3042_t:CDS:2 [Diversispora eburnea]
MSNDIRVNVVGAGVIGLTTALILQRLGYKVQIIAEHFPGDYNINYTSPWAGADWRFEKSQDKKFDKFLESTYKVLSDLSNEPGTGLKKIPSEDLPPNTKVGLLYTTVTIDVPKYLHWLFDQFIYAGGATRKVHISHINEAFEDDVHIVVNCTGICAKTLGGVEDNNVYPTKGQTVSVWAPHVKAAYYQIDRDVITYIIPRESGEVICGGIKDEYNYTAEPDPKLAEDIIQRCAKLCPQLIAGRSTTDLKIMRHNVGRRPSRLGGTRIEVEIKEISNGKTGIICHNYGHHSYGYASSWGSCSWAVELIEDAIKKHPNLIISSKL